jgi:carboxypeptidase C (cathepsin A)
MYKECPSQSNPALMKRHEPALDGESTLISRDQVDRRLLKLALDPYPRVDNRTTSVFETRDRDVLGLLPCVDERSLASYLNQANVRAAIHVPKKVAAWDICARITYVVNYPKQVGGLAPQVKVLINSKRKLALLFYNGDVGLVCNFLGNEWFVDDLGQRVISDYSPWYVGKQMSGFVKRYDGITFATIRGSGHLVASDKPQEALHIIKAFFNTKHTDVLL